MSVVLAVALALPVLTPLAEHEARCEEVRVELRDLFPVAYHDHAELRRLLDLADACDPEPPESHEDAPDGPRLETQAWAPTRTDWGGSVEEWRPLVAGHFDPEDVETALCLMSYESGGNPNAKNPRSSASGLFQLLAMWHDHFGIDPFIPEQNVYAAARLKALYGWSQWSPYNRGLCRGL